MQGNLEDATRTVELVTKKQTGRNSNNGTATPSMVGVPLAGTLESPSMVGVPLAGTLESPSMVGTPLAGVLEAGTLESKPKPQRSWLYLLLIPRYMRWLIGTAGAWFLLDIAYYGTTISSPLVLKALNSHANLVTNMFYTLIIFVVAALPGYIVAILTIDRLGRKWIQCFGFGMMALAYGLIVVAPALSSITLAFLLVYGVSYFFTEFGPNVTTFVYPAELFPVMVRTTAHGIAAALGKVGAFIGAFAFPYLLLNFHLQGAMAAAAIVSLAGLLLTIFTLPEPNQRSLEEISDEHAVRAEHEERELALTK
jgi:MFS transporter, PHS family, inorganic phosphate transporter